MPARHRPALRPLPPDLDGAVRAFVERLRESYWERLELNQRELAAALHVSKSPVSRYLNGQEIVPAATLERFFELARHTPQERDRLRRLRDQAEAALSGSSAEPRQTPVQARPAGHGPRLPRVVWVLAAAGVVVGAAGAALVLHGSSRSGTTDVPGCENAHRRYTVTAEGDVLDAHRNDIGDVHPGDSFTRDTPPTNPYSARHYGHVRGNGLTGFVDQAKLEYVGEVCD